MPATERHMHFVNNKTVSQSLKKKNKKDTVFMLLWHASLSSVSGSGVARGEEMHISFLKDAIEVP